VAVEIADVERPGQPLYRATFELSDRAPGAPAWSPEPPWALRPFPRTLEQTYREWLFHGPLFQNITDILGIGESGISGAIVPSSPRRLVAGAGDAPWQIDPVVLDCGLQLALVWSRARQDMTPLPSGFRRLRLYERLAAPAITCHVRNRVLAGGHVILSELDFVGSDGRILASVEGLEIVGSRALNRLSAGPDRL
jgi:hypothetical protein